MAAVRATPTSRYSGVKGRNAAAIATPMTSPMIASPRTETPRQPAHHRLGLQCLQRRPSRPRRGRRTPRPRSRTVVPRTGRQCPPAGASHRAGRAGTCCPSRFRCRPGRSDSAISGRPSHSSSCAQVEVPQAEFLVPPVELIDHIYYPCTRAVVHTAIVASLRAPSSHSAP